MYKPAFRVALQTKGSSHSAEYRHTGINEKRECIDSLVTPALIITAIPIGQIKNKAALSACSCEGRNSIASQVVKPFKQPNTLPQHALTFRLSTGHRSSHCVNNASLPVFPSVLHPEISSCCGFKYTACWAFR